MKTSEVRSCLCLCTVNRIFVPNFTRKRAYSNRLLEMNKTIEGIPVGLRYACSGGRADAKAHKVAKFHPPQDLSAITIGTGACDKQVGYDILQT